jgi:hypothetical protein
VTARELPEGSARREAAATAAPDDAQQIREEIERTREHLAATVEQLAARADVKGRAQARARQLTWQARSVAVQARKQAAYAGQQAAVRAGNARGALTSTSAGTQQKAIADGQTAPAPVRQADAQGADMARKRQVQLSAAAAAVGVLAVIAFLAWQRRKR